MSKQFRYFEILLFAYIMILLIMLTVYAKFLIVEEIVLIGFIAKAFNAVSPLKLLYASPAATIPFALTYPICDIVAEVYGPRNAKKMMLYGVIAELVFALGVLSIISLPGVDPECARGNETIF